MNGPFLKPLFTAGLTEAEINREIFFPNDPF